MTNINNEISQLSEQMAEKGIGLPEGEKKLDIAEKEEDVYSSGLESDTEFDLLAEQEVLTSMKIRK